MKHQAFNPYLPSYEYVPDGEPRVFGDRVYVYGSHDLFDGDRFCMGDYVCWSAPVDDLGDWRWEGVIFRAEQDPKWRGMNLYAPDVVQGPDGKYYLYYCLHADTLISVAVCDTPAGDYQFYGYVKTPEGRLYGSQAGDVRNFDPGVLVDDDGRVFLYSGFAPMEGPLKEQLAQEPFRIDGAYCMELEKDMVTMVSQPVLVVPGDLSARGTAYAGHGFFEASSIRKIQGKYYFVYSSQLSHELCYATSDRPDGGFSYGGILVSIGDLGLNGNTEARNYLGNTHGGMVQIQGQWYIFYHRQTNKQMCARQGCAEKISILPGGSIAQAEITSCGLNDGPLSGKGRYEARIACNLGYKEPCFAYWKPRMEDQAHPYFTQSGTDREEQGDQYIANMRDGAWCGFKYFQFEGEQNIQVRVRCSGSGTLEVSTSRGGAPIARLEVRPCQDWETVSGTMEPLDGVQPLYFVYRGDGAMDFDSFTLG